MRAAGADPTGRQHHPPAVEDLTATQRDRRARIVEAAIGLILTVDHSRIQMKDVTAAAGVALGTTYRYFASKDHLLAEALLAWSERFPVIGPAAAPRRSVDQLKAAYRYAVRAFEPHPTAYDTMLALQRSSDPLAVAAYEEFAQRRTTAFATFIPGIPSPRREDIVMVMSAVLDNQLRGWAMGRLPIADVYRALEVTADLLLGDDA
jgi:AcrR family transcriptional regulator